MEKMLPQNCCGSTNRHNNRFNRSRGPRGFEMEYWFAAARLTVSLGDQSQNRNEPQVSRALHALSPFDPVSRDRLSSIGFRSARLRMIAF